MIQKIFAVYDSAAKAYLSPFCLPREEMALRSFRDAVNSEHQFANHPEDYTLFLLGEYDNRTGQVQNHTPGPKLIGTALELKTRQQDVVEEIAHGPALGGTIKGATAS